MVFKYSNAPGHESPNTAGPTNMVQSCLYAQCDVIILSESLVHDIDVALMFACGQIGSDCVRP